MATLTCLPWFSVFILLLYLFLYLFYKARVSVTHTPFRELSLAERTICSEIALVREYSSMCWNGHTETPVLSHRHRSEFLSFCWLKWDSLMFIFLWLTTSGGTWGMEASSQSSMGSPVNTTLTVLVYTRRGMPLSLHTDRQKEHVWVLLKSYGMILESILGKASKIEGQNNR